MILAWLGHVAEKAKLTGVWVVEFAGSQSLFQSAERTIANIGPADDQDFVR